MAVNVSVRQFDRGDLPAMVGEVLAETGMPADQLCLEMTESVLMTDTEENLALLVRLKAIGVTLAIDDFGTGYSSLATCAGSRWTRSRSTARSSSGSASRPTTPRWPAPSSSSARASACPPSPRASRSTASSPRCARWAASYAQGYYFSRPVPADEAGRLLAASSQRADRASPAA